MCHPVVKISTYTHRATPNANEICLEFRIGAINEDNESTCLAALKPIPTACSFPFRAISISRRKNLLATVSDFLTVGT